MKKHTYFYCVLAAALLINVAAALDSDDDRSAPEPGEGEETPEQYALEKALDDACEWTRQDVFDCVKRHARDVNEDGKMDANEIRLFKKKLLGWFGDAVSNVALSVGKWFGNDNWLTKYTVEEILHRCGDDDGYITITSFHDNWLKCEKHCRDWTRFMNLCTALDKHPHQYRHLKHE